MAFDTIIRGGTVATASDTFSCDVGIAGGVIAALGKDLGDAAGLVFGAAAISGLAAPMLLKQYSTEVQTAQLRNLAFLSQTRVRILNPQQQLLADSGPWGSPRIGIGVAQRAHGDAAAEIEVTPTRDIPNVAARAAVQRKLEAAVARDDIAAEQLAAVLNGPG